MRKEIARLQARQRQSDHILDQPISQKHSEEVSSYQSQNGETREAINRRLRRLSAPPTNVTTYARLDDRQAIQSALAPAQSAGHRAFSKPEARPVQNQHTDTSGAWNAWPGSHTSPSEARENNGQVDEMSWAMDFEVLVTPNRNPSAVDVWHQQPRNPILDNEIQSARNRAQDILLGHSRDSEVLRKHHAPHNHHTTLDDRYF